MRREILVGLGVLCASGTWLGPPLALAQEGTPGPVLQTLKQELTRSFEGLRQKGDPAPYFIGYRVTETQQTELSASYGAISRSRTERSRKLDLAVRVGDYALDSSHRAGGDGLFFGFKLPGAIEVPLDDDPDSLRAILWLETDRAYKQAVERLMAARSKRDLKVKEDDQSADFSREAPLKFYGAPVEARVDEAVWRPRLKEYSRLLLAAPEILESKVTLRVIAENKLLVNSEGTEIQQGRTFVRLSLEASTKAEDGMDLFRYEAFDVRTPDELPGADKVAEAARHLLGDLVALRKAPVMDPYTGPAIMTGRAAGVFFHEIFGHRVEGHRQKDQEEGQTFTKEVGKPILPAFVSVIDDPTIEKSRGIDLRGFYRFDDEGIMAQRVTVVENGVLRSFLMGRAPILGFARSNGHGRAEAGFAPVARQGNLIISSNKPVSSAELRRLMLEECRRQGKPYGLLFSEVMGGFTFTGRGLPQAFDVYPVVVYRVYVDGRPDELVRGVELIGTPLTSFSRILAMSDKVEVFNGTCGAESGGVPVSSVAPEVLTAQIEVQKKEKSTERPPVLPAPEKGRPR